MQLQQLIFRDHFGDDREWLLQPLILRDLNLIVGVNASGKSRAVGAIGNLAWLISAQSKIDYRTSDAFWTAVFKEGENRYEYTLRCKNSKIIEEAFKINGEPRLERAQGGEGEIFSEVEKRNVRFQTPDTDLAIASRRDSIQHSFFEPLHSWAASVYKYEFGTQLGKNFVAIEAKGSGNIFDPRNQFGVVAIFATGLQRFGPSFVESIKKDMATLDYLIDDISLVGPTSLPPGMFPEPAKYLCIKETSLRVPTEQPNVSQGMFRALSIIIQIAFSQASAKPACMIIDDIGEGLDFGRSCALIELLIKKAMQSQIQLIMSTNDRFVMNKVPLESWTLLHRKQGNTRVFNYANSKEKFDDFRYTGLNNFDFFATEFMSDSESVVSGEDNGSKKASDLH